MAFDFSKLNFFGKLDARARVMVLLSGVIVFILLVYFITRYFTGGESAVGPSKVATAPQGLQSAPGTSQVTAEYYQAIKKSNLQTEQAARLSGGSAIPIMVNTGYKSPNAAAQCNIICSDQSANVKTLLDDWVKTGKMDPEVASMLQTMADKNVSVPEYAALLDKLVKEGKITPEQARELLEQYKKQHANALLQESAKFMDDLMKSGALPLDVANDLLNAQKNGMSVADYAAKLQELVRQGKISPETAAKLLAQYTQQRAREGAKENLATIAQMLANGEITPDVAKTLADLASRNVPVDEYAAALQRLVAEGKITPAAAAKLLEAYRKQKEGAGPQSSLEQMIQKAEADAYQELKDLLQTKQISTEVATKIADMIQQKVPLDTFKATINQMVTQGKLKPDIAQLKIADYEKVMHLRETAARLAALQANNASPVDYANELKRAVAEGSMSPDEAAQLMQQYQAMTSTAGAAVTPTKSTEAYNELQKRLQEAGAGTVPPAQAATEFATVQTQTVQEAASDRQARIDALTAAMSAQSGALLAAWQPPTQEYRAGSWSVAKKGEAGASAGGGSSSSSSTTIIGAGAPMIKAGTILFAVLDTAVNSDYPDSPVLATIVDGKLKGAKLMGKLTTTKSVSGQMDRVTLNFSLMDVADWPRSKSVTAYAIDPDTARTVLASSVNYHYLMKYGAIMGTSLLQGYSSAITTSGSTTTTGIFGTSSQSPVLNSSNKLMVALGQIGQNMSSVTQNWTNIPPTVRVDSGVSLGILFMADVT